MRILHLLGVLSTMTISLCFSSTALAQQIGTYPTTAVELQPGIFVCDTEASLRKVLNDRSIAMREHSSFDMPLDCGELLPGISGEISYVGEYQDRMVRTDVVKYTAYRTLFPGIRIPVGTFYGYGETHFKIRFDPTLPLWYI